MRSVLSADPDFIYGRMLNGFCAVKYAGVIHDGSCPGARRLRFERRASGFKAVQHPGVVAQRKGIRARIHDGSRQRLQLVMIRFHPSRRGDSNGDGQGTGGEQKDAAADKEVSQDFFHTISSFWVISISVLYHVFRREES